MIKTVRKKLEEILDKEIVTHDNRLSNEKINAFENKFQIKIPEEYRWFLVNYSESYINSDYQFPMIEKSMITPKSGFETIDFLYSSDFIENAEQYISNYGKEMIPIGEASGDNVCIGVQGDGFGKIYYVYHEDEDENLNYYLIAESFDKFILSFEKRVENMINLDEVEIELDDDLWND